MAAPIVYRWDDANAPVARGERRSLCDILYACLVTGYGTKPAAGWTREYVNATFDRAVFRNNPITGTGFYLQVDGLGGPNAYTTILRAYEVMTSDVDGLMPFHTTSRSHLMSDAANTTARPWVLIADDRFFYFSCWSSYTGTPLASSNLTSTMFFGDIIKWYPSDAYACIHGPSNQTYGAYLIPNGQASTPTGTDRFMPRKSSGAVGSAYVANLVSGGGPADAPGASGQGVAYTPGGAVFLSRPYINDGGAYTFRGWLPGLYSPCHSLPFGQLETVNVDGRSFLSLRTYTNGSSYNANLLISLDDWRV